MFTLSLISGGCVTGPKYVYLPNADSATISVEPTNSGEPIVAFKTLRIDGLAAPYEMRPVFSNPSFSISVSPALHT
jgi:hypothetical protein